LVTGLAAGQRLTGGRRFKTFIYRTVRGFQRPRESTCQQRADAQGQAHQTGEDESEPQDQGLVRFQCKIGQLTDVSHCNLQHHFYCNRVAPSAQAIGSSLPEAAERSDQCSAGQFNPALEGIR
jgi:hypothetical protein